MTARVAPTTAAGTSTNGLAIASLVTSLLGFSLFGVILGHVSQKQIRQTGQGGRGLATAGLVLGYLGLAATLLVVVLVVLPALGQAGA